MMKPPFDLKDTDRVLSTFAQATELNRTLPARDGNLVQLPGHGRLVVSGDLHGNHFNMEKVFHLADLDAGTDRHVIFQELIHGPRLTNGMDFTYRTLAIAAHMQLAYPGQVHVLMGNHELAQRNGDWIMKDGINCGQAFELGMDFIFDEQLPELRQAINRYIESLPLAVRTLTGLLVSHSLPSVRKRMSFDTSILQRDLIEDDLAGPAGDAFLMVWGRNFPQYWLDELAEAWDVETFIIGHQPADMGYDLVEQTMFVINSDDDHGVALAIDLAKNYQRDQLLDTIRHLNAVD